MKSDTGHRLIELAQGVYVERDALNIVEKVRAYDSNLDIQYLDPDAHSDLTDAPYRIIEKCPDGFTRVVFSVWQLDDRVLERLYNADTRRMDVLANITHNNMKAEAEKKRRYEESKAADDDLVVHILKSPKTTYTYTREDEAGDKEIVKIVDDGN